MGNEKLRQQIAHDAARLMYLRQESEYYRAKLKAARRICRGWVKPQDLPSNSEIRDEIQTFARIYEGSARTDHLRDMRIEALRIMRHLLTFRPRLIGSTLTGHVRKGSDIDIHVFSESVEAVAACLEREGYTYEVERKRVRKAGDEQIYTHIHVTDRYPIELTVYGNRLHSYVFKSSITGKAIERANIDELEELIEREYAQLDVDEAVAEAESRLDRFQLFEMLLLPLEAVKQSPKYHPEGDALYHSLQVFDLVCDHNPYDEELLTAALLHDIGKAIDPHDHVNAGLEALGETITPRTAWLIENHMLGHKLVDGTIGSRARRRLKEHESYEDLILLAECDSAGREPGVEASDLREALDYLRELAADCEI